jgi:hypothetical protein
MQDMIAVAKIPYLIRPDLRDVRRVALSAYPTVGEAIHAPCSELRKLGFNQFVVTVNGYLVGDLTMPVNPGDFVAVSVKHGIPVAVVAGIMAVEATAMSAIIVTGILNAVIMIGAGLLINTFMPHPTADTPDNRTDSPTYGFKAVNPVTSGSPVAVVYGHTAQTPQVLASYRKVDPDYNMWQYLLLGLGAGPTNNAPLASSVYVGDELVTSFSAYIWGLTSGILVPSVSDLITLSGYGFSSTYHDRAFDRIIKFSDVFNYSTPILLHLNAEPLVNSGEWPTDVWTLQGTSGVQTDTPKFGAGYLHFNDIGDYIQGTDDKGSMTYAMDGLWELEFWARFPDTSDRALFSIETTNQWAEQGLGRISLVYVGGVLYFQAVSGSASVDPYGNPDSYTINWEITLNMSGAVTLPLNTWTYFRLHRVYDPATGGITTQLLVDIGGTLTLIASDYYGTIRSLDNYSTIHEYFGKGFYCAPASEGPEAESEVFTELYGLCDLDEIRFTHGRTLHAQADRVIPIVAPTIPANDLSSIYYVDTNGKCAAVDVLIEFPQGLFRIDENGQIRWVTVNFTVYYELLDHTNQGSYSFSVAEDCQTAVRQQIRITLPFRDQWRIAIQRTTNDDTDTAKQRSQSVFMGLIEILDVAQSYPGLQLGCLGVKATDRTSGQLPAVKVIHERTLIEVPNWSGSGAQYVNPQNPAWAAYDMFTNPYSGRRISPTNLIQSAWEEWRDWCDGTVDGYYRCRCNITLDTAATFSDQLKHIEEVGRARVIRLGNKWYPIIDKPRTASYTFSAGNILPGSFSWDGYEDLEKVDAVEVVFWDKDRNFNKNSFMAKATWYETLDRQPNVASIQLRACNSLEEATRHAIFRMQKTEMITRHGSFDSGLEAIFCERGDVVNIIHPTNIYGFGGKLARDHASASTIYLDQIVNMPALDYSGKAYFFVIDPNGAFYSFPVTGPFDVDTQTITITGSYTGYRFDSFAIGRPNQEKLLYQIVDKSIVPSTEKDMEVIRFSFVEYVDAMFYNSAYGSGVVAI